MDFKNAKKLHNHDQITIKATREITEVIKTEVDEKNIVIYAITRDNGYTKLNHKDIY